MPPSLTEKLLYFDSGHYTVIIMLQLSLNLRIYSECTRVYPQQNAQHNGGTKVFAILMRPI